MKDTTARPRTTRGGRGSRLGRVYRHRHVRSDRGAALVEAAIILPVLLVFLLGIIEFGLVYATGATATGSSRSGARLAAATFGPNRSDMQGTANAVAAQSAGDLQALTSAVPIGMVVYKVDPTRTDGGPSGGFPASNNTMSGGCTSSCFRYTWNAATKSMTPASSPGWNMTDADVCFAASTSSVGVWVLIRHSYLTQLIGKYTYVTGKTVMRLEPVPNCNA